MTPEQKARQHIDQLLRQSGWEVQDYAELNITRPAIAVREFPLKTGWLKPSGTLWRIMGTMISLYKDAIHARE